MSEVDLEPDVVVIGAGPGGYAAGIRAAQLGLDVLVVEKEENVGGVCLNWGCIPTKALYSATEPLARKGSWERRGVQLGEIEVDLEELRNYQDEIVEQLTGGVEKVLQGNGVTVVKGRAKLFPGPKVVVEEGEGEGAELKPKNVILATGSQAIELPGFSFEDPDVWNSRQALDLEEIPERLLILGAGVIGLEMATIYNRLGSSVRVLELQEQILPAAGLDRRIRAVLNRCLKKDGIDVKKGVGAKGMENEEGNSLKVIAENGGEREEYEADKVLLAVGRRPALGETVEGIELESEEDGSLWVDHQMQSSQRGIYAIGDLAGEPLLAHKATREGLIAAAAIAGEEPQRPRAIPQAIFTDPQFAEVGMDVEEAREAGYSVKTGRFPFRASGKALAMDRTDGLVQLVVDEEDDRVLGGAILGPEAADMISEVALAVENGLTAEELAGTIHPHPTLPEAIMEAAEDVHDRAVHIL